MKLRNLFFMLLALPLLFVACNDNKEVDEVKEPVLTLTSAETLEFSADAATGEISYKLENPVEGQAVAATADVEWINNFQYGEKVTFAVEANETTEAREGKITVTYTTLSFEVTVKQAGKVLEPEVAIVAGATAEFEAEGGNGAIEYELKNAAEGVELTVACEAAWVKDVKVVAADSKVTYTIEANTVAQSRNATIVLTYGEAKAEAAISQKPHVEESNPALSLKSEATAKFKAEGGNGTIKYELINPAEGVEVKASCEADWVSALAVNATNSEVSYTVAANTTFEARSAKIKVAYGELSFEVTVEQEAAAKPELTLKGEANKEFAAEGGKGEFAYVLKNAAESIKLATECKAEWIKDITIDETNSKVTYNVTANEGEEDRTATIALTYGELKVEATIKQLAKGEELVTKFTLRSQAEITVASGGKQGNVIGYILENPVEGVEVAATANVEWITIGSIDTEKKRINFDVSASDTGKVRTGVITATYGEYGSFTVTVNQNGCSEEFYVRSNTEVKYDYKAQSVNIAYDVRFPVDPTVEVTATVEYLSPAGVEGWITTPQISKNENVENSESISGYVAFSIAENTGDSTRSAKITYTYGDKSWSQTISQTDNQPDPVNMEISSIKAIASNEGQTWKLEINENAGDGNEIFTYIVLNLAEANKQFVTAGTYTGSSIKDGVITTDGNTYLFDGSIYRQSVNASASEIDGANCTITVDIDKENATAKISGSFISYQLIYVEDVPEMNRVLVSFEYDGEVDGFTYADLNAGITEWESFGFHTSENMSWLDTHTFHTIIGTAKGGIKLTLYFYQHPAGETFVLADGVYEVGNFFKLENKDTANCVDSASKNGENSLVSGSVTVSGQKITIDVTDNQGNNIKGTYTGPLEKL